MIASNYILRRAVRKVVRPMRQAVQDLRYTVSGPVDLFASERFQPLDRQRVLVIIAHPDDEIFCSGLVAGAAERGASVGILCMTRGEGGEAGELLSGEELGRRRELELREAARVLGAKATAFLGYRDPRARGTKPRGPRYRSRELVRQIADAIEGFQATLVVTHGSGGEYWHPAHVCLHDHVRKAVRRCPYRDVTLLTMNAWTPGTALPAVVNQDDLADFRVDGSAVSGRRAKALACHRSQLGVFERFSGGAPEDFIRLSSVENYRLVEE